MGHTVSTYKVTNKNKNLNAKSNFNAIFIKYLHIYNMKEHFKPPFVQTLDKWMLIYAAS